MGARRLWKSEASLRCAARLFGKFPVSLQPGCENTWNYFEKPGTEGIYPDILHICDLQIIPDCVASSLWEICQRSRNKETCLAELRTSYEEWCSEAGRLGLREKGFLEIHVRQILPNVCSLFSGIPHGSRAARKLFTVGILSPSTTSYAHLSQKMLKGAAAKIIIYWLCGVVCEKARDSPCTHNRFFS